MVFPVPSITFSPSFAMVSDPSGISLVEVIRQLTCMESRDQIQELLRPEEIPDLRLILLASFYSQLPRHYLRKSTVFIFGEQIQSGKS